MGYKILILEDEAIVAEDVKSILQKDNYKVVGIYDKAKNAVRAAKKERPDMALLDIKLEGGEDGISAAEKLKDLNIPFIFVTAYGDKKILDRAKKTEPEGYLYKPFGAKEILTVLEMALYKKAINEKLKISEVKYKYLFDHMNSGSAVCEAIENGNDFIIKEFNLKGESICNIKKEKVIGKKLTAAFPMIKKSKIFEGFKKAWSTGQPMAINQERYKDDNMDAFVVNYIYKLPTGEVVSIFHDLTDIEKKLQLEKTISSISSSLLKRNENLDEQINKALAGLGKAASANRSYIFLFNGDQMDNSYEWCAPGVTAEINNSQGIPKAELPWLMKKMENNEIVHIIDVSKMPSEAMKEKQLFKFQEIKSLLLIAIKVNDGLFGFIGFDNVYKAEKWKEDSIVILQTAAQIIGSALERNIIESEMKKMNDELVRTNNLMVGRELKMIELKKKIKELEIK